MFCLGKKMENGKGFYLIIIDLVGETEIFFNKYKKFEINLGGLKKYL